MMFTRRWLVLCVMLLVASSQVSALRVRKKANSKEGFAFLGMFCFINNPDVAANDTRCQTHPDEHCQGLIDIDLAQLELDKLEPGTKYYIFDDDGPGGDSGFDFVYRNDALSCETKVSFAANHANAPDVRESFTQGITQRTRPRFWYVVMANCGKEIRDVEYEMHMYNPQLSKWRTEFTVPHMGLNTVYLFGLLTYAVLVFLQGFSVYLSNKSGPIHLMQKLFSSSLVCQFLAMFFYFLDSNSVYSSGWPLPACKAIGQLFHIVAHLSFMALLLLIANGWLISNNIIFRKRSMQLGLVVLAILYFSLWMWGMAGMDPASTLYIFQSVPGVMVVLVELACSFWFVVSVHKNHGAEPEEAKKALYKWMGLIYSPWFAILPFMVFVSLFVSPWVREKSVVSISFIFYFIGYSVMIVLLWPTRSKSFFKLNTHDVAVGSLQDDTHMGTGHTGLLSDDYVSQQSVEDGHIGVGSASTNYAPVEAERVTPDDSHAAVSAGATDI